MYHLFSIIATLSVVSAIPLPQYELPPSLDFVTSEPSTTIDTAANADSYSPPAPFYLSEGTTDAASVPGPSPPASLPARRPGLDLGWDGKDRVPGDQSGFPKVEGGGDFSQEALDYWKGRGFPRIQDGRGTPATPNQNGGRYSPPSPIQQQDNAPPPEPLQDAGIAGAATSVIKGIIDRVPNSPAVGY